jgi:hypothetical protein
LRRYESTFHNRFATFVASFLNRRSLSNTLAAPFDRDKAERARLKFIETQVLIDAIDRAIAGEQAGPAA